MVRVLREFIDTTDQATGREERRDYDNDRGPYNCRDFMVAVEEVASSIFSWKTHS